MSRKKLDKLILPLDVAFTIFQHEMKKTTNVDLLFLQNLLSGNITDLSGISIIDLIMSDENLFFEFINIKACIYDFDWPNASKEEYNDIYNHIEDLGIHIFKMVGENILIANQPNFRDTRLIPTKTFVSYIFKRHIRMIK